MLRHERTTKKYHYDNMYRQNVPDNNAKEADCNLTEQSIRETCKRNNRSTTKRSAADLIGRTLRHADVTVRGAPVGGLRISLRTTGGTTTLPARRQLHQQQLHGVRYTVLFQYHTFIRDLMFCQHTIIM